MNAIILASGPGSRMKPYTDNCPKVLFKVNGEPLLIYHIKQLLKNGVTKIFITTHHLQEKIWHEIYKLPKDIKKHIWIYEEKKLIGSGGAIRNIMVQNKMDRALIIYGDTYYDDKTYSDLKTKNLYDSKWNIIFTIPYDGKNRGIIYTDEIYHTIITRVAEEEYPDPTNTIGIKINAGLMVLNKNILIKKKGDLMKDVLPKVIKRSFGIYPISNFTDIGTIDNYINLSLSLYDNQKVNELYKQDKVLNFIKFILQAKRIFICGNGGSLSTTNHLALDWGKVGNKEVIDLTNSSTISAYGNDCGYDKVFLNQLSKFTITKDDVLVLISTSGNSPNLCKVMDCYKDNCISLTGKKGILAGCISNISVDSDNIRVIEDTHLAIGHAITEILEGLRLND